MEGAGGGEVGRLLGVDIVSPTWPALTLSPIHTYMSLFPPSTQFFMQTQHNTVWFQLRVATQSYRHKHGTLAWALSYPPPPHTHTHMHGLT